MSDVYGDKEAGEVDMMPTAAAASSSVRQVKLVLIAAISRTNGLGVNGSLPWRLPKEMAHFRRATSFVPDAVAGQTRASQSEPLNAVIMGRKTWQSIPPKFRPLKGRINIVVSRQAGDEIRHTLGIHEAEDTYLVHSLDAAVDLLQSATVSDRLYRAFLIGGAQLYTQALQDRLRSSDARWTLDTLLITRIQEPAYEECDVFLPEFRSSRQIKQEENGQEATIDGGALYEKVSQRAFDEFMGASIEQGVIEEKGSRYVLQMWTQVKET